MADRTFPNNCVKLRTFYFFKRWLEVEVFSKEERTFVFKGRTRLNEGEKGLFPLNPKLKQPLLVIMSQPLAHFFDPPRLNPYFGKGFGGA